MDNCLIHLAQNVLVDIQNRCCISTTLDFKTVQRRVEAEGESFLTITLAGFGKDFERSLDQGYVDRHAFAGFQRKLALPRFCEGLLGLIFDRANGVLLDCPDKEAIRCLRQFTLMWAKIKSPCTPARDKAALEDYIQCERELAAQGDFPLGDLQSFQRIFGLLYSSALQKVEEDVAYGRLVPKHGPGKTAERVLGNQKFSSLNWTTRLDRVFPSSDYLLPNHRHLDRLDSVQLTEPWNELPVRVVTVPKTLSKPRIIAIEPVCMQYTQQAVLESLVTELERKTNLCSQFIGFTHQEPNQVLAREGSINGHLATIDLSEASDRVDNRLVVAMLDRYSHLNDAVQASRSTKAEVRGKGIYSLTKFASMGSALCFPIEAMVFSTLVFLGIERERRTLLTRRDIKSLSGQVRVYGDDIVVPVEYVRSVISTLEDFRFRVNKSKSFWTGKFRESCGKDYYDGFDVSIVKVRQHIPTSQRDVEELISTVATRNLLYLGGYWTAAKFLDDILSKILRHFPVVLETSALLGRVSVCFEPEAQGISKDLQVPLVKGWKVQVKLPPNKIDGVDALQKFFLKRGIEPFADTKHLERSGRPETVNIKLGMAQPY